MILRVLAGEVPVRGQPNGAPPVLGKKSTKQPIRLLYNIAFWRTDAAASKWNVGRI